MKKRLVAAVLSLSTFLVLPGCASILDGDFSTMTPYKPVSSSTGKLDIANTYDALKDKILSFVMKHETSGLIRADTYDGDIDKDADRVCEEIMADNPYAAYAVENMSAVPKHFVPYYEISVHIQYRDEITKTKMANIDSVSNRPYLKAKLQEALSSYAPSLTVLSRGLGLTADNLTDLIKQIYYENPRDIVMLPVMPPNVKFYPDHGPDQIVQFTFVYKYESGALTAMAENLKHDAQRIAGSISGNNTGALLLNACQRLMSITEYDDKKAKSGDYSTPQNIEATAYGALENHSSVGEGYAMAYKVLCDVLGIECYVVLGERGNVPQAWNIVKLDGYYYHIDVSMCDVNGIATAFLKSDTEMSKSYTWDSSKYKVCNGPMTYQSLLNTLPSPSTSASPSANPSGSPSGNPSANTSGSPTASPTGGIHTT